MQVNWYSFLSIYFLPPLDLASYIWWMYSFIVCEICLSYLTCFCLIPKMTFDIQYKYMSIIIFYQNTSTMLYSTIPKPSPSQRLSHLSPFQSFPHLPVNFLLGAGGPCHLSLGNCNLEDCIGFIGLLLLFLLYWIDFVDVLLLLSNLDLFPFKISLCGDWLKFVGHFSSFILELGPEEDHHCLDSFFLCCFSLSLFILCSGF